MADTYIDTWVFIKYRCYVYINIYLSVANGQLSSTILYMSNEDTNLVSDWVSELPNSIWFS